MLTFLVILLLVGFNALYVAAEFAAVSARRTRVSEMANAGHKPAQRLLPIIQDKKTLDRYIAACQIGITLSSLVLGFYSQAQLAPVISPFLSALGNLQDAAAASLAVVLVLLVMTTFQVVLGELLPKSVAVRYPESVAVVTLLPMTWSLVLLSPMIALFNGSAFSIMRRLNIQVASGHSHVHSPAELELLITQSAQGGLIDAGEREMIHNALRLDELVVRQIMVPRPRMVSVKVGTEPRVALADLLLSPHTRFPVYEGSIDQPLGIIHLTDLALLVQAGGAAGLPAIVRKVPMVPESLLVSALWQRLRQSKNHMAIVFDEYGGTAGLVTLEDIVEEIVGEVQDEFDREAAPIWQAKDGRIRLRGDVLVSTVNDRFDFELPEDITDTIGGLVFHLLQKEAHVGDEVLHGDLRLRVEAMQGHAVSKVTIVQPPNPDENALLAHQGAS
jgi:CBS domain containing-hemolysin-like protein